MDDDFSNAAPRRLPWELRDQAAMSANTGADTGDVGSFVWPEDPDERTLVPFYLSQREYTALASAIDVGSDIAYGDDAIAVWWLFVKNMRYPVPICDLVTTALLTCEDVQAAIATLIATSPVIQDAVRDFVTGDPALNQWATDIAQNQVLSLSNRGENLLKPDECNPDFLFNQSSALVQLCHDVSEDIFEGVEVGTNQLERADIFVGMFPAAGFNDTAATVFRAADQLVEEVAEDYSGAYDEALYDDIRCKIFCACKDDCLLSIDKAIDVYKELLGEEIPTDPIEAFQFVLQFIGTGDFPTDSPVYIMHLLVLTGIRVGSDALGIDFGKLANRILAAGDEGDNDWELLCEDCGEPPPPDPHCQPFLDEEAEWSVKLGAGEWIDGEGYKSKVEFGFRNLYIHRPSWIGLTIARVKILFTTAVTNITVAYDNGAGGRAYTGTATTEVILDSTTVTGWTDIDSINGLWIICQDGAGMTDATRLIEVCLYPPDP